MGEIKFPCSQDGCGLETKFVRLHNEEYVVDCPDGEVVDLSEIHIPEAVARNFLIECPVHGELIIQNLNGHHITAGRGKRELRRQKVRAALARRKRS